MSPLPSSPATTASVVVREADTLSSNSMSASFASSLDLSTLPTAQESIRYQNEETLISTHLQGWDISGALAIVRQRSSRSAAVEPAAMPAEAEPSVSSLSTERILALFGGRAWGRQIRRLPGSSVWRLMGMLLLFLLAGAIQARAQGSTAVALPKVSFGVDAAKNPKDVAVTLQILFMMTILTLAPSILLMTTAFTRLIIVFSIFRSALGTPQVPPNQVMVGLALFLTFFIMQPTFKQMNEEALTPYMNNKMTMTVALDKAERPLRRFMMRQTYENDLNFFLNLSKAPRPNTADDVGLLTLIPAFLTSELKTAFTIGFYIYLPFLIIDMVVASTLMSMGMMMLPPVVVSLPAKLLLFVLANGWALLIGSLVQGFR